MAEQWGKYRLRRLIARGGMAEVHEAELIGPSGFLKPVCLKQVRPEHAANADFVQMFESEARIAATLHHPNVVEVYDFDRHEGRLFLVMELVDGLDLRDVLAAAGALGLRVPPELAVLVMDGLLAALAHAHGQQVDGEPRPVIHRDVSPHNILLTVDGLVKLADFGIAKARGLSDATRTGVVKGKFAYLSPEQARGGDVGPASDLFSAGLVLYEMLAGRRLFRGGKAEELVAQVLAFRSAEVPGASAALNGFLGRLLAPDPADRFPGAAAAREALAEVGVRAATAEACGKLVALLKKERADKAAVSRASSSASDAPSESRITQPSPHPAPGSRVRALALGAAAILAVAALALFAARWRTAAREPEPRGIEVRPAIEVKAPSRPAAPRPAVMTLAPAEPAAASAPAAEQAPEPPAAPVGRAAPAERKTEDRAGTLEVNVKPWAKVAVDGVERGTTPIKNLELDSGPHRLTLVNEALGYEHSAIVQVRPGQRSVVTKTIGQ